MARLLLAVLLVFSFACCNGESNPPDSGIDAGEDAGDDAGDNAGNDAGDDAGQDAGDSATDAGDTACPRDGKLGDACLDDCGCQADLACRGLPSETVCSVPCQTYPDCDGKPVGCANPFCDLSLGACRCICQEGACGAEYCMAGYCIGCGADEHCKDHDCSATPQTPRPRCRPDTETCVCSGDCGDGNCDGYEQALSACPEDCSGPCQNKEVLSFSCMNMETVPWCTCQNAQWECLEDPTLSCHGENRCIQMGGQCSDLECYEGTPAAEPHGCVDPSPLCCLPAECVGAGMSYYPYLGLCCPGLRAVPSRMPMADPMGDIDGVYCFDTCWALICAPCGDGACQLHMGENFCTCPEDCPHPPYTFACTGVGECGTAYCRQEGAACIQHTPRCADNQCQWSTQQLADHLCNPVTRACDPI